MRCVILLAPNRQLPISNSRPFAVMYILAVEVSCCCLTCRCASHTACSRSPAAALSSEASLTLREISFTSHSRPFFPDPPASRKCSAACFSLAYVITNHSAPIFSSSEGFTRVCRAREDVRWGMLSAVVCRVEHAKRVVSFCQHRFVRKLRGYRSDPNFLLLVNFVEMCR